jgi:hypothetical protein
MKSLRNVTITLDEEVARWARVRAAEANTSVSRLLGEELRRMMRQQQQFDRARRDFQRIDSAVISDDRYPRREDLRDRPGVR